MKLKLTKMEKAWILYDVGNSAFILLVSTIIPIYFDYLADLAKISAADYLAYWGYAASVATLVVAVIGPVFGTMADTKNLKKKIFFAAMLVGTVCCAALGVMTHWLAFLVVFVIGQEFGYSSSIVFYDAMLTDVTTEGWMMCPPMGMRGGTSEAVFLLGLGWLWFWEEENWDCLCKCLWGLPFF